MQILYKKAILRDLARIESMCCIVSVPKWVYGDTTANDITFTAKEQFPYWLESAVRGVVVVFATSGPQKGQLHREHVSSHHL